MQYVTLIGELKAGGDDFLFDLHTLNAMQGLGIAHT
jgi:hypothetical protein